MDKLQEQVELLKSSGKLEKIKIFNEIFKLCFNTRNPEIFNYFNKFLEIFRMFIDFNGTPDDSIKMLFTESYVCVVKFARNMNNIKLLEEFYSLEKEFKDIIIDDLLIAELYQSFGYLFSMKQDNEKSIKYLEASLNLIQKTNIIDRIPGRFTNLGYIYESMGKFEKAEKIYLDGLEFAKNSNYETSLKLAYAAIGRLHSARTNYHKSILYYKESLELFKDEKMTFDQIAIYLNLASVYTRLKDPETALEYFEKIDLELVKRNDLDMYFSIILNMGVNLLALDEYEESEVRFLSVLEYSKKNKAIPFLVGSYINLGNLYRQTKNYEKSLNHYLEALLAVKLQHDERQEQIIYQNLGVLYIKMKDYDSGISNLIKAEELAVKQKNENQRVLILEDLSHCYQRKKFYKESLLTLQKSIKLKEKYEAKLKKKEKELASNPLINTGSSSHYLFKNSKSLISSEITRRIGNPIIGTGEKIRKAIQQSLLAAKNNDVSVLLRGESGTGKELFAKLIHFTSQRERYSFIDVNSASFTTSLAESTLFGHIKGAFTGASFEQKGLFLKANKGTLFLDEIAEMPFEIQAKFLRVLETKMINPIGSHKNHKVDFRLISATHQDLEDLIEKKSFRFDLYNRINTIEIKIPPLRDRREDLPLLIDYYSKIIAEKLGVKEPKFTSSALTKLYNYNYPGNIRELINILERVILFSNNKIIDSYDILVTSERNKEEFDSNMNLNLEDNEVFLIKKALSKANGVKTDAAKLLGLSPYSLKRRIDKFDLG